MGRLNQETVSCFRLVVAALEASKALQHMYEGRKAEFQPASSTSATIRIFLAPLNILSHWPGGYHGIRQTLNCFQ